MDYFNEGFVVRTPSWHRKEYLITEDLVLPGDRDRAYVLAGHDYTVVEKPNGNVLEPVGSADWDAVKSDTSKDIVRVDGVWHVFDKRTEKKGFYIEQVRDGKPGPLDGNFLEVTNASFESIPNDVGWDLMEVIAGEGAKLDTGFVLHDGATCVITAYLDEPVVLPGDDSNILPYLAVSWGHDGTRSLATRATSVREVCANTVSLSEALASRNHTDFTFRHTKNWRLHVEDAKLAIRGLRDSFAEYTELARELGTLKVTPSQRELFVATFLPMPPEALISDRVKNNVDNARSLVRAVFDSRTVPEDHKFTGYGLHLAGIEYLDHLRGFRKADTYVGRQLLRDEPAKAKLASLIKEVVRS